MSTQQMDPFHPIASATSQCKCCGAMASLYGVVDFNKNCEIARGKNVLPLSGIPIYYHRCPACGFLFTTAFDQFTHEQFRQWIYNDDYIKVDPDYAAGRPRGNAQFVAKLLGPAKSIRILDYGGGNGQLVAALREMGFENTQCYDPFVPASSTRPEGKFDCVLSFEVVEHSPTPKQTLGEMISLVNEPGIILFSTLFQPPQFDQVGLTWWYAGPRNGHLSLYSRRSMELLAQSFGYRLGSFNDVLHVLVKVLPPFAAHWAGGK
jgi:hypothetical protein